MWFSNGVKTFRYVNDRFQLIQGMYGFRRVPRYNPTPVYALSTDSRGNVWGRTADGVMRWSATGSTIYSQGQIGINNIQGCTIDRNNLAYLDGKDSNGKAAISLFDGGKWLPLRMPELKGKIIELSTRDPKSGIWYLCAGTQSDALSLMRVDRELVSFQPLFPGVDLSRSPGFDIDLEGNLWVTADDFGLHRLRPGQTQWEQIKGIPKEGTVEEMTFRGKELWFNVMGEPGSQLVRYANGEWKAFEVEVKSPARAMTARKISGIFTSLVRPVLYMYQPLRMTNPLPLPCQMTLDLPSYWQILRAACGWNAIMALLCVINGKPSRQRPRFPRQTTRN